MSAGGGGRGMLRGHGKIGGVKENTMSLILNSIIRNPLLHPII